MHGLVSKGIYNGHQWDDQIGEHDNRSTKAVQMRNLVRVCRIISPIAILTKLYRTQ
jgi:hypothetical protein